MFGSPKSSTVVLASFGKPSCDFPTSNLGHPPNMATCVHPGPKLKAVAVCHIRDCASSGRMSWGEIQSWVYIGELLKSSWMEIRYERFKFSCDPSLHAMLLMLAGLRLKHILEDYIEHYFWYVHRNYSLKYTFLPLLPPLLPGGSTLLSGQRIWQVFRKPLCQLIHTLSQWTKLEQAGLSNLKGLFGPSNHSNCWWWKSKGLMYYLM